ncbi:Ppx/GppA family phosphatase [Convivina praedatoris]|uniref:Exopolyphosphatase n=1 Tax=Convivina praedatoris TaxID=2880963 RepID=A0ABN8H8D5_9LACO|nr:Ppx/GppA family phosphatase [Convivina sp. LMG 32447]CAH1852212.1 Exopolyphosphatase [Convivina sp. LMG 32447]CAH1852246.1 Exopolyphosphatase [Convivina sp. LMG 32447]CAH1852705.1 Exopolyphosphatase [Convivina sp. LMG 32447]
MAYLGIIDLGSNSARMVIEDLHPDGSYTEILREKTDTRIAQNMGSSLVLQPEPMRRTIAVLKEFKARLDQYGPLATKAITTAAVRTAKNQTEFLDLVRQEVDIEFEVLTGTQEAHYDYLGVMATLSDIQNGVILDTGGASVELIGFKNRQEQHEISLPFGAVNLSEKYQLADDVKQVNVEAACASINQQYQELKWLDNFKNDSVILLGGANRSLARVARAFNGERQINNIHGFTMSRALVEQLFDQIRQTNRVGREKIAGLEKSRADIIISGLLPLLNLMKAIDAPQVIFSESGVREGIIAERVCKLDD